MGAVRRSVFVGAVAIALVMSATASLARGDRVPREFQEPDSLPAGDWRTINRNLAATRYSPLAQIDTDNVAELQEAWTYSISGFSQAVPLVIGGVMYLPAGDRVVALDADTGEEIWTHPVEEAGLTHRGVGYWPGDGTASPRIFFTAGGEMRALDAATGTLVPEFGTDGIVQLDVRYMGSPTIYRDAVIIGANVLEHPQGDPGNPRAFDARTGEKLWEFQTVPRKGEPYNETWGDGWKNRSGTNMWAFAATVDAENGIVYLPISSPSANYWGGDRPGKNLFGNSIVAVDAETGEYLWHFQTVHHDLWDSDMPSAGALFDVVRDGRRTPVIAHVGKTSWMFVLNRLTGEPVFAVEERPVPEGGVPGEWYSPTQPFPVKPPPLSRVAFSEEDLVTAEDTTPGHAAACRAFMERSGGFYNAGPFTPFLFHEQGDPPRSTIQLPGGIGGVNWGGVAVDPTTNYVYANTHDTSLVGWIEKKEPGKSYDPGYEEGEQPFDRASVDGKGPYFNFSAPLSGEYDDNDRPVGPTAPCYKPPWARLTAVDADTGEIVWEVPLGLYDYEDLPKDKRRLGNSGSAGPTVTAGGLVFIGATNDQRFRAFDAKTGAKLWSAALSANANANPMTYLGKNGRQYVAVIAMDTVLVYALPD